ncbi:MAG: CAP domain-containing protein [Chloroflexota bacterium]
MRRTWIFTILFVICLLLGGTLPAYADNSESQVFALVNARRLQNGLPPLALSGVLATAARAYASTLAGGGFFSHTGLDGSTFITRDEAAGYTDWDYLEENLAGGQQTPEQVVAAWLASPEHRANLLSPNVREIGIGHVYRPGSKYLNYWVQEFGDRPGAQLVSYVAPSSQAPGDQGSPAASNPVPSS